MITVFNTGETQDSLRREYNPDGSILRRAQLRMLDMLDYLVTAAEQAGVSWRLDGGNVLGALRHGGFIPWDDDVDIVVDWKDYKRFCDYLKQHPHPQYLLQDSDTDAGYWKFWASFRDRKSEHVSTEDADLRDRKALEAMRFRGLHIDIFPYEDRILPRLQRIAGKLAVKLNLDVAPQHPQWAWCGYRLLNHCVFPIFRLLGHFFGKRGEFMHSYGTWFYERFPLDVVRPYKPIRFEGRTYNGPARPEDFCRIIYGDYMALPPRDKRNRHQATIRFLE